MPCSQTRFDVARDTLAKQTTSRKQAPGSQERISTNYQRHARFDAVRRTGIASDFSSADRKLEQGGGMSRVL